MAKGLGATLITTDVSEVLADDGTDGVMICSSQPEHYEHIRAAVAAGKAVFIEKPMVTRLEDFAELLRLVEDAAGSDHPGAQPPLLADGRDLRKPSDTQVDFVEYLITQPFVPPDHWTLDPVEGGGRLITEGEHFIDLCNLLIGRRAGVNHRPGPWARPPTTSGRCATSP